MNSKFSIVFCLPSLVLAVAVAGCATEKGEAEKPAEAAKVAETAKKPAAKPRNASERLRAFLRDEVNAKDKKLGTVEALKLLEEYRTTNPDCTNQNVRVDLDYAILDRCRSESTPRGAAFDAKLARATVEKVAPRIYDDPALTPQAKFKAVDRHCTLLCDQKRYDEALKIAQRYVEMKDAKGNGWANSFVVLKNVYRLMDRYPDALAAMKKGIAAAPQKGDLCAETAKLALEFGDAKSVPAIWALDTDSNTTYNAEYKTMSWVLENKSALDEVAAFRDAKLNGVLPFVSNVKNPANQRLWLACRAGLIEDSQKGAALRKAVADVLASGKVSFDWGVVHKIRWMFMDGNWAGFAAVYGELKSAKALQTPELRRAHLYALAAAGRADEAKKLAAEYRAEMTKPVDLVKTDALMAVIEDRDALAVIESAKLAPKEHAQTVQLVSEWALVLQKNDACRKYADAYAKLIVPIPQRRQNVTWSAKPLDGEAEWRALWPSLEKSYIDVKMCGDLDNLVTDVATGRISIEKTDKDTKNARVEVTSACDVKGLHLYLRVADPNARAVEDGFAGGKGTEMYFAPGDNQPYICFGGGPRDPLSYLFDTTYTWEGHQRLVKGEPASPYNMKGETFFTDDDYTMHFFFPWDAFYQKLPTAGTEWKFDCLTDGFSWGGSQGVHESTSWGRLVFNLKAEELTAIRRRILLKNAKTWSRGEKRPYATVAIFDRWADPVVGDPAFYEASLKPLEAELKAYAKRVTPEMTDADVNDIYEHAVPRWIGLKHVIDRLRREYLIKKNLGL